MAEPVVAVREVSKSFPVRTRASLRPRLLRAVKGVSFDVPAGQTLGLVGESGSGKTTVANIVAGLMAPTGGQVSVSGHSVHRAGRRERRRRSRKVQVVFQDPYGSFVPTSTLLSSLREPLRAHGIGDKTSQERRVDELLALVQLDVSVKHRFPSELSGGQLQRIGIARALALEPDLVVLDEPVSALDVSTKAEVINLLADLKTRLGLTYLFISHDLSTLRLLADRIAVMYLGEIVEIGEADQVFDHPAHPYTQALLASVPIADPVRERQRERVVLPGDIPSPIDPPGGCPFHTRCPAAMANCATEVPSPRAVGNVAVACHLYPEESPDGR